MSAVYCFGEVLWDCLPRGLFLGGAPLNVAAHLARLGVKSAIVSAVGCDVLGDEAAARIAAYGVDTRYLARSKTLPTGSVGVKLDEEGAASYEIRGPVAWDEIPVPEPLHTDLAAAQALVFGSLATRSPANLASLLSLMDSDWPMRVFDVNLRAPFYSLERVLSLAGLADLVKCNEAEARELCGAAENEQPDHLARRLADATDTGRVCITLGARGAVYLGPFGLQRAVAPRVKAVDTVGAGDAFLAAMVAGILKGEEDRGDFLMSCCRLGAYVAGCEGAVPEGKQARR
jgi:fructokinase